MILNYKSYLIISKIFIQYKFKPEGNKKYQILYYQTCIFNRVPLLKSLIIILHKI